MKQRRFTGVMVGDQIRLGDATMRVCRIADGAVGLTAVDGAEVEVLLPELLSDASFTIEASASRARVPVPPRGLLESLPSEVPASASERAKHGARGNGCAYSDRRADDLAAPVPPSLQSSRRCHREAHYGEWIPAVGPLR